MVTTKNRTFEFSGINLRVHSEHSAAEYRKFWLALYRNREISRFGNSAMIIGSAVVQNAEDDNSPISGYFYKFLDIDPTEPWFNINKHKPATDVEISELAIPEDLKPNLKMIPYVFLPSVHQLYFISKATSATSDSMAASTVLKLLSNLTQRQKIVEVFGVTDLTVITDTAAIDNLFLWQSIRTLEIFIERPNALEDEDEEAILDWLDRQNAGSQRITLKKASDAGSLTPDDKVKSLAYIAANNGEVKVEGRNVQGQKDRASSKQYPMHEHVTFRPNEVNPLQALLSYVSQTFL